MKNEFHMTIIDTNIKQQNIRLTNVTCKLKMISRLSKQ